MPPLNEFHCNTKDAYRSIQEPPLKNSDHNMIHMQPIYRRKLAREKPEEKKKQQLTEQSLETLNASFDATDWDMFIDSAYDIDELVDTVTEYIKFNTNMILPVKAIKQYPNNKPWITSELRKQIIEKHQAFKTKSDNYREKQTEVDEAIKKAKASYKDKVEQKFKNKSMKDMWQGLKILTGQSETKKSNNLISTPGSADRLNSFFSRFDDKDFSTIHKSQKEDLEKKILNETPITISEEEVYNVLRKVNTNKATGPDKISGRIVKECISSLLYIIHSIYSFSIEQCRMPNLWKIGEIIPVNKKPFPKVDNDLRPVTLTAILAKCFERIVLPKISDCTKPVMDKLQFAYLPNRSTDDAIITLIHALTQHLDHGSNYARCLFIDYSSAFNTMQPHVLINRLNDYNIPARLQLFILDFLTNRKQYVRTDIEHSSTINVNTGAHKDVFFQRSCLSSTPILYPFVHKHVK